MLLFIPEQEMLLSLKLKHLSSYKFCGWKTIIYKLKPTGEGGKGATAESVPTALVRNCSLLSATWGACYLWALAQCLVFFIFTTG